MAHEVEFRNSMEIMLLKFKGIFFVVWEEFYHTLWPLIVYSYFVISFSVRISHQRFFFAKY